MNVTSAVCLQTGRKEPAESEEVSERTIVPLNEILEQKGTMKMSRTSNRSGKRRFCSSDTNVCTFTFTPRSVTHQRVLQSLNAPPPEEVVLRSEETRRTRRRPKGLEVCVWGGTLGRHVLLL